MYFLSNRCVLYILFLNLIVHSDAQGILGALLGGVQDGLNILTKTLDVGHAYYPPYAVTPPANRAVSFPRLSAVPQSNQDEQNESEEPYNSNSEQHQGGDSKGNSEEYNRDHLKNIKNNKLGAINSQGININQPIRSPDNSPGILNENRQSKLITKTPALLNNQKPMPLERDSIDSSNTTNTTTTIPNSSSTTSVPLLFLVNITVTDKNTTHLPEINESLSNHQSSLSSTLNSTNSTNNTNSTTPTNSLNFTNTGTEKPIEKDTNKNILKSIRKRKFFFQAKPVIPLDMEDSMNETIYYIDLE